MAYKSEKKSEGRRKRTRFFGIFTRGKKEIEKMALRTKQNKERKKVKDVHLRKGWKP